ncbi:MAG: ATP-binding protein [Clostridia bacterium]|nr:ATP-binding protein [Clostridia bacterium]
MYLYGKNDLFKTLCPEGGENIYELLNFAERYGLSVNLKKAAIAWVIMKDENPFSLSCERSPAKGSAEWYARADIAELCRHFFISPNQDILENYTPINNRISGEEKRIGQMITDFVAELNSTPTEVEFFDCVKNFYATWGVGDFGINKAFYMQDDGSLNPVSHIKDFTFEDICGYDIQKQKLISNSASFTSGGGANNVLLYGDSGTGKSTSIKAVLNMFYDKGLRMIQIQKHQFRHLSGLTEMLKRRNYRFVLYMDDLSFEDFEVEYKYLKAAIEGGLEEKPENVLIYATSNRRHLIKETFTEREGGDDIHRNESIQEKISLSDRFGLSIFYPKPAQQEYFEIVEHLAQRKGISIDRDQLIAEARKWGIAHGGYSGRTATQFIEQFLI